ncbi:MAG: hypothetical protein LBJ93_03435 [Clostridiales bacterium]|nr:hypothetical protein [Clostridiales bacterium]
MNWLKDNEPPFDMVRVAELTTELARDGNINIPDLSKTNLEALQEHVKVLADVVHARERGGPAGLDERTGPPGSDITLNV